MSDLLGIELRDKSSPPKHRRAPSPYSVYTFQENLIFANCENRFNSSLFLFKDSLSISETALFFMPSTKSLCGVSLNKILKLVPIGISNLFLLKNSSRVFLITLCSGKSSFSFVFRQAASFPKGTLKGSPLERSLILSLVSS